jgi:3-hydroxymyristoyl/3-hydroxydecanoyl-(acyl carrier protein) dehydratase
MEKTSSIEQSLVAECLQSVTVEDSGRINGIFTFAPDFPGFAGHFPGHPVLPAVVQLAAVRFLAAGHLGRPLVPTSLERVKFKTMIGPEEPVTIFIHLDQSANDVTISFTIATCKGKAATGEITCRIMKSEVRGRHHH